ncbi:MAG: methyltransferase domain-containing protein [Steroidobacteraceae bacterium]
MTIISQQQEGARPAAHSAAWDPGQYERFKRERAQPFFDLVTRIPDRPVRFAADLGCGTGELTRQLLAKWPAAQIWGVDNSGQMLERARGGEPNHRLVFVEADLRQWRSPQALDCIVSNAALHWVPDHAGLLAQLASWLAPGGILAVQMPNTAGEPAYRLLAELTAQPRWAGALAARKRRPAIEAPEWYVGQLRALGHETDVWETIYYHQLPDALAIVEWLKGTSLRPILSALSGHEALASEFLSEYASGLTRLYPASTSGVIFPFRRLFFLARRS